MKIMNFADFVSVRFIYALLPGLIYADQTTSVKDRKQLNMCKLDCVGELGQNRKQICYIDSNDVASVGDPCNVKCEGKQQEESQHDCLCNYCKYSKHGRLDFCLKPGKGKGIVKKQCDELACTAQCGVTAGHRKRNGGFVCYEHAYLNKTYLDDPCEAPLHLERKEAKDQPSCFCNFCKDVDGEFVNFCKEPGKGNSIRKEQCDELVCTGKVKYHGSYCTHE